MGRKIPPRLKVGQKDMPGLGADQDNLSKDLHQACGWIPHMLQSTLLKLHKAKWWVSLHNQTRAMRPLKYYKYLIIFQPQDDALNCNITDNFLMHHWCYSWVINMPLPWHSIISHNSEYAIAKLQSVIGVWRSVDHPSSNKLNPFGIPGMEASYQRFISLGE